MSRHRNVRTMNFEDEYFDEDEVYGHSYDDSYCVSPATAAQFTFNRERDVNLSSYMEEGIPEEEDESDPEPLSDSGRDNLKLDDVEQAKLNSCKEEIVNVIGDTIPEHIVSQAVVKHQYNIQAALNELLNQSEAPKPQRQPRPDRRANRQDEDDDFDSFLESLEADGGDTSIFSNLTKMSPKILHFGPSQNVVQNNLKTVKTLSPEKSNSTANDFCEPARPSSQLAKKHEGAPQTHKGLFQGESTGENKSRLSLAQLAAKRKPSSLAQLALAKKGGSLAQITSEQQTPSVAQPAGQKVSVLHVDSGVKVLPLAQLATKHKVGTSVEEKKPSLALLAAKQKETSEGTMISKSSGVSLADLAAKETKNQSILGKKGASLTQLLNTSKELHLEKSPKTSLAQLAQKHKQTSNITATVNEKLSKEKSLAQLALKHKNESCTETDVEQKGKGISLAQLASKHKTPLSQSGISLMQVAKQKEERETETKNVSLSDLVKQNKEKSSDSDNPQSKDGQQVTTLSQPSAQGLSLRDLVKESSGNVLKDKSKKFKQLKGNDTQTVDSTEDSDVLHEGKTAEDLVIEKLSLDFDALVNITKGPSCFGKVICGRFGSFKNKLKNNDSSSQGPFSYAKQKQITCHHSPEHRVKLVPFDFSTPSPDDIIKEKQKRAFTRPKERNDSK